MVFLARRDLCRRHWVDIG